MQNLFTYNFLQPRSTGYGGFAKMVKGSHNATDAKH